MIDENFRTLYKIYPSIRVARAGDVSPLPKAERPLPEIYSYKGETHNLADFLKRTETTGFIVLKDGEIVHEEYARGNTEKTQSIAMSVSKSFVSFLIGNAVRDGQIKLDETVDHYAPVLAEGGYKGVTVKNVLQMSSGIGFNENYGDLNSDIVRYIVQMVTGSVIDFTAHLKNEIKPAQSIVMSQQIRKFSPWCWKVRLVCQYKNTLRTSSGRNLAWRMIRIGLLIKRVKLSLRVALMLCCVIMPALDCSI